MQLSQESYRTRWLVLVSVWTACAIVLWMQATIVDEYLGLATRLGLRGALGPSTPLVQIFPAFAADAHMWVRHALSLLEGDSLQLRHTMIDNAPLGREVHWNTAWAWCIAGAGKLHQLFTGLPLQHSVERATVWLNPLVMFGLIVALSAWATRRAGLIAGVIVAISMLCHERIYEGFFPTYVDHHGLLTVAVLGMLLGAVMMGGGWWQDANGKVSILPQSAHSARQAAIFSALCGACGLWVSAASVIPAIAITGLSALAVMIVHGRVAAAGGATFDAQAWRLWGRVGASASIVFYLFEYFPRHLGFRLEPNHPFHALAWLGGGELIAQLSERWIGPREQCWAALQRLAWPAALIALTPLTILIGGSKVFTVLDPFLARLHNDYIQEFAPMWRTVRGFSTRAVFQVIVVGSCPLIAAVAYISYRRRETPIVVWFITFVAVALTAMAWWQSRWLLNATGAMICIILVLIGCWTLHLRTWLRWVVVMAIVGGLFIPSLVWRYVSAVSDFEARRVAPKDAYGPLHRDIAMILRASQPQGELTVLSSPNSSLALGYFGRFKTLGTLYWENNDGLKAAAAIHAAKTEQEAATLIRAHGVTHIAMISEENFIGPYFRLLNPASQWEDARKSFGAQLLFDKKVPQWLQMLPYKVPPDLASLGVEVMLFKVNFQQNIYEAIYNAALYQVAQGLLDEADRTLDVLIEKAPQLPDPWLRKAELALTRHNWNAAAELMLKGISLAPPANRPGLYASAGQAFYNPKQHALAVRMYRTALAEKYAPDLASYLAWVLATSDDNSVRNGKEALALAEEALKADPNSASSLSALAAALAEIGRFQDAVAAGDRALAAARVKNEPLTIQVMEQRLAQLRSGKPIRN